MQHFLALAERDLSFTDDALRALLKYRWPGNVRELRNVVEQLVWLSAEGVVGVEHLPVSMRSEPGPAHAERRSPQPGRRRVVRRARQARRVILGARLSDVPGSRHHAPRSARARSARPARVAGPLQVGAHAVRHVEPRLSPLHELPGGPWLRSRRPRIPSRRASSSSGRRGNARRCTLVPDVASVRVVNPLTVSVRSGENNEHHHFRDARRPRRSRRLVHGPPSQSAAPGRLVTVHRGASLHS